MKCPSRGNLSRNTLILTICLCGLTFSAPHYHLKNCVLQLRSICRWVRWEAGLPHHLSKATALITSRDDDYSSWLNIHHRSLKLLCLENSRQLLAVTSAQCYHPTTHKKFGENMGFEEKLGTQKSWKKAGLHLQHFQCWDPPQTIHSFCISCFILQWIYIFSVLLHKHLF